MQLIFKCYSLILCFYDSCFKSCQIILTSDSIQYWLFFSFRLWLSWSWVWHMVSLLSWTFYMKRLLLLLSRFSRVRLCATPQTAAHQAPPSLGFSRQELWSGLPSPSPAHGSEVAQSSPTLRDPMEGSPPGSSLHGIFQARVLEWGALAFSEETLTLSQISYFSWQMPLVGRS